jgi:hypothetical protein
MNLKEKVTETVGGNIADKNPFITSEHFLGLMKAMAQLAKVILMASSGPAEAMNGIQSLVVTFLKNVPDKVWEHLKTKTEESGGPGAETFVHLHALRSYGGSPGQKFVEIVEDGDMPDINSPMPKHPC